MNLQFLTNADIADLVVAVLLEDDLSAGRHSRWRVAPTLSRLRSRVKASA